MTATQVEIAGIGIHPFGRFEGRTVTELGVAAVRASLAEAGLGRGGFQAAFCGTAYGGVAAGHKVLDALGMTGTPIFDVEAGCASGAAALILAADAIRAGQHDAALVYGIEKMPKGIIRSSFFEPWREEAGLAATPSYFALRAQRLMHESGVTLDHLARVVVKNRRNGVGNPAAMRLWMLCSPNEGAAAVVLRRSVASSEPTVKVAAAVLRSHLPGNVLSEATPMSGRVDDSIPAPTTLAATSAYETAGLGPSDLDVAECQDTDAARELLSYEELGLCPRGDAGKTLEDGATEMTGRLPVNPSGGLLSKGEPLGASALGQVVELTLQLRGDAGPRQVPGARTGLAHTVGRGANASVVVLKR